MKTKTARITASTILVLDSHWMPFSTPEIAEKTNATVRTAMIRTSSPVPVLSRQFSSWNPLPIWSAPRPSDAAEPKSVAKMARMSMKPADGAVGVPGADERLEHGADRLPPAAPVGAVRDGEPDDRVDGPRMERPVEEGGGHRRLHRVCRVEGVSAGRRVGEVGQRLTDAIEHETDAHRRR